MIAHDRVRAVLLALGLGAALAVLALVPQIRTNPALVRTFLVAASVLAAGAGIVLAWSRQSDRPLRLHLAPHRAHWIQAAAQSGVFLYWGWHVRIVYDYAPFILAQLLFAYGCDALLSLFRRGSYELGFGPFPIVFSINLFLWFKPEWFHWQFAMVAVGYAAKEFIRWTRQGRSTHIFNPSSFPLALFSLVLILTGTTNVTFGPEIAATQAVPPHIYAVIFLVALPGQILFGVATMTVSAVIAAYGVGLLYFAVTGTYFFLDSYIPAAVFLGMHLLFTDPSTSPRSVTGRILFGGLYGIGVTGMAALLFSAGAPGFYDKLLVVPILNLCVRAIDQLMASRPLPIPVQLAGGKFQTHLAFVGVWAAVFVGLTATRAIGDRHPGQWLPFWETACAEGRSRACDHAGNLNGSFCELGSAWACNELGTLQTRGEWSQEKVKSTFERACVGGLPEGCENLARLARGSRDFQRGPPRVADLPIVLRGAKGPVHTREPAALYALACERGWPCSQAAPARCAGCDQ